MQRKTYGVTLYTRVGVCVFVCVCCLFVCVCVCIYSNVGLNADKYQICRSIPHCSPSKLFYISEICIICKKETSYHLLLQCPITFALS